MSVSLAEIMALLGDSVGRVIGPTDRTISGPASLQASSNSGGISFCTARDLAAAKAQLLHSGIGVVLCRDLEGLVGVEGQTLIMVDDPRLAFIRVVQQYFSPPPPHGIDPTAKVHLEAQLHSDVYVGPFACIAGPSEIGQGTIINSHVCVYANTRIGANVVIHPGAVLGADGFGFQKRPVDGVWEKFPHLGGVVIEDEVEIGANSCVDRGTLGDTLIRKGVKIDNLVHIAHNVEVGQNTAIAAGAVVGGSTRIGRDVWLAPGACLMNKIQVGDGATIGLGAIVEKDVPDGATIISAFRRVMRV